MIQLSKNSASKSSRNPVQFVPLILASAAESISPKLQVW